MFDIRGPCPPEDLAEISGSGRPIMEDIYADGKWFMEKYCSGAADGEEDEEGCLRKLGDIRYCNKVDQSFSLGPESHVQLCHIIMLFVCTRPNIEREKERGERERGNRSRFKISPRRGVFHKINSISSFPRHKTPEEWLQ
jgi:hypothetical protein